MGSSSAENKPASRRQRKAKSICLPFDHEAAYPTCMSDPTRYRAYIISTYRKSRNAIPFHPGTGRGSSSTKPNFFSRKRCIMRFMWPNDNLSRRRRFP